MRDFLTFAHQLADASGKAIRPYFGTDLKIELKADQSPVSLADSEAEAAIRALIEQHYPEHGIFGEEFGSNATSQRYVWVIDPIDGTRAFIAGKKEWGTLIALCEDGIPILGILDQPITGERWVGMRGETSHYLTRHSSESWNPPITLPNAPEKMTDSHPRGNDQKAEALTSASLSSTSKNYFTPLQAKSFVTLAEACAEIIENGDCYAYGMLARGARDLVADTGLKPYDILALVPIVEGAGGVITGWDGAAITLAHYDTALAAGSQALHQAALSYLR